jgi:hypothetical protein
MRSHQTNDEYSMPAFPVPPSQQFAAHEPDDALQAFPPGALESRVTDRYGEAGNAGWSPIPDVLLFNQHRLGIQSDDLVVLLNLMAHYYVKDEMPFTRPTTILARSSELEASNRSPSSADSITAMRGYRFSVHTGGGPFCAITRRTLPPWICSLPRLLASNYFTAW